MPMASAPLECLVNFVVWSARVLEESAFRPRFKITALAWCTLARVLERWDFWKPRFNDCLQAGISDAETADLVKAAVAKME